jgi:hypothetical protein
MTTTNVSPIPQEDLKAALLALMRENNAELKLFLSDLPPFRAYLLYERSKFKQITASVETEQHRLYKQMPFWKAHPEFKPIDIKAQGYGITQVAFKKVCAFFQEPGNEITDEWFEMLD